MPCLPPPAPELIALSREIARVRFAFNLPIRSGVACRAYDAIPDFGPWRRLPDGWVGLGGHYISDAEIAEPGHPLSTVGIRRRQTHGLLLQAIAAGPDPEDLLSMHDLLLDMPLGAYVQQGDIDQPGTIPWFGCYVPEPDGHPVLGAQGASVAEALMKTWLKRHRPQET